MLSKYTYVLYIFTCVVLLMMMMMPYMMVKCFRRWFPMSKMFMVNDLEREVAFFRLGWDARGRKGFTPLQNCTSVR